MTTPASTDLAPPVDPPASDAWRTAGSRAGHPSSVGDDQPLVAAIASGLAAVSAPWELATGMTPTERSYELLLATDAYDVWAICWPAGTGLAPHDHGGSTGAFAVVSGALDEDVVVDGVTSSRTLRAGESVWFDADHVHGVVNRGDVAATSVHVYAPPLHDVRFLEADGPGEVVAGAAS